MTAARCCRCEAFWQPWALDRTIVDVHGRRCRNQAACDRRIEFVAQLDRIVARAKRGLPSPSQRSNL